VHLIIMKLSEMISEATTRSLVVLPRQRSLPFLNIPIGSPRQSFCEMVRDARRLKNGRLPAGRVIADWLWNPVHRCGHIFPWTRLG
jgi:hypothetical protein